MSQRKQPEMTADAALELVKLFDQNQIEVIIDGGWAVDALLGEQTRTHLDLDIAMPHKYVQLLRVVLSARGYEHVPRDDDWEANFVLGDHLGHEVDIHTYTFDNQGMLVFGVAYPYESLDGRGTILGYPVRCIPADWLVKFHMGYKIDENDYHDVKALCQRFGMEMPAEYVQFEAEGIKSPGGVEAG